MKALSLPLTKRKKDDTVGFLESLKLLFANKYYIMIVVLYIVYYTMSNITTGSGVYFAKYVLGDASLLGMFQMMKMFPVIIALIFTPMLVKKAKSMQKVNFWGYVGNCVLSIPFIYFAYQRNVKLMLLFMFIKGIFAGTLSGTLNALIAEISGYTYRTKGVRMDGTMFSCSSLGVKIGGGIGTAAVGWLLDLGGYIGTAAAQTDDLDQTVNYGAISRQITQILQRENHKLLERAAAVTAEEILLTNPLINGITIKIEKPWAPVGLPLETVAVETTRKWHTAYIALGSNLGEKKNYLDVAIEELKAVKGIQIESVSDWIETEPYGYLDQPNFLNGCACLRTWLEPFALLDVLQSIEAKAGRERKIHWGPRTLDLDLLFYDDQVLGTKRLIVPHPEIEKRSFVLVPMAQIAPWLRHPVSKSTIKQLLEELNAEQ